MGLYKVRCCWILVSATSKAIFLKLSLFIGKITDNEKIDECVANRSSENFPLMIYQMFQLLLCYIIDKKMMSRWTAIAILNLNFQKKKLNKVCSIHQYGSMFRSISKCGDLSAFKKYKFNKWIPRCISSFHFQSGITLPNNCRQWFLHDCVFVVLCG